MPAAGSTAFAPLAGVTVLERAGALSVAACTHLLSLLGARVVRLETPVEAARIDEARFAERRLRTFGKERIGLTPASLDSARKWLEAADVVVLNPPDEKEDDRILFAPLLGSSAAAPIVCSFSLTGLARADGEMDSSDAAAQALGGLMAVSGRTDGPPEQVHVPVAHMTAAVIGVTSILSALALRRQHAAGHCIDLALSEIMADQLRTHLGLIRRGRTRGFRSGCEHPLCSPWNAYRARDGWLLICSSGDAHWRALTQLMRCPELANDKRFATMKARREHGAQIDALVQEWVGQHDRAAAIEALRAADIPVGPALSPRAVPADPVLQRSGVIATDPETGHAVPAAPWRFRPSAVDNTASAPDGTRRSGGNAASAMPLAGIRVVELTRYAAGPLAGFMLASLGADVIKVEPPQGEECRGWSPQFGGVSGYFANHNAGKRSVTADLRDPESKRRIEHLLADADVLLHNMRPGAMERLGLGGEALCARHSRLVYCAISGFGPSGPPLPALDTVIQGHLGLTALVGDGAAPIRVGYSIADQLAGHFAAAGIVGVLHARTRTGAGGMLDVAMADALAWLTHSAWHPDFDRRTSSSHARIEAADGWVVALATAQAAERACPDARTMSRAALIARLEALGIRAAPVLEADEVLQQPALARRGSLCEVESGGECVPVFAAPLGMPVVRPRRMATLGEDSLQWNEP